MALMKCLTAAGLNVPDGCSYGGGYYPWYRRVFSTPYYGGSPYPSLDAFNPSMGAFGSYPSYAGSYSAYASAAAYGGNPYVYPRRSFSPFGWRRYF